MPITDLLEENETIEGDWAVHVVFPFHKQEFYSGELFMTNKHFHFNAKYGFGKEEGEIEEHFRVVDHDKHIVIEYDQIEKVEIKKRAILMNDLVVSLKSNEIITFRFGFLSANKALAVANKHLA
ncbi:MAG TPA: hypothetical protein ENK21_10095 [Trueperaceae bacterium]|nr:hypothetical protein [Trueperaceae bacterium]